jgi:hypothetical protein
MVHVCGCASDCAAAGRAVSSSTEDQPKPLEFIEVCTMAIADADDRVNEVECRKIDHALLGALQHLVAVVLLPDVAAEQRR